MTFQIRNLSQLSYAQGFTLWHYKPGDDNFADVTAPGYFDGAIDFIKPGDVMHVTCHRFAVTLFIASYPPDTRTDVMARNQETPA